MRAKGTEVKVVDGCVLSAVSEGMADVLEKADIACLSSSIKGISGWHCSSSPARPWSYQTEGDLMIRGSRLPPLETMASSLSVDWFPFQTTEICHMRTASVTKAKKLKPYLLHRYLTNPL